MNGFRKPLSVTLAALIFFRLLGSLAFGQDSLDERFQNALKSELSNRNAEAPAVPEPVPEPVPAPLPEPVPDLAASRKAPRINYELPARNAGSDLRFVFYTGDSCIHCERMKSAGFVEAVESAGFVCESHNVSQIPKADVRQIPQVWLYEGDTPIRRWIGYTTAAAVTKPVTLDGACQLKAANKTWSGFAIAPGFILTCAHHEERTGFFARFPTEFGRDDYVQARCELVKIDPTADLCLLSYQLPELCTVDVYPVSDPLPIGTRISGYLEGTKPKRLKLSRNDRRAKVQGIAVDGYFGEGVTAPQLGMSGSPILTEAGRVVGVQVLGLKDQIDAVSLETITAFLAGVDLSASRAAAPALMTLEDIDGDSIGDSLAAALALHSLAEFSDEMPTDAGTFASLINVDFDAPDYVLEIARQILAAESISYPAAGVSFDWSGDARRIDLKPGRLAVTPGVSMTVSKFGFTKRCRLDAITYKPDLSEVTFELSGMLDLTVRLK